VSVVSCGIIATKQNGKQVCIIDTIIAVDITVGQHQRLREAAAQQRYHQPD
jgi:hypothetical protein